MSNLLPVDSSIALHLTDRALTPLISTATSSRASNSQPRPNSQTQTQSRSLSTLTTAALTACETASRLGLGAPQRLMIETPSSGPILLHSFLNPQTMQPPRAPATQSDTSRDILEQAQEELRPLTGTTDNDSIGPRGERSDTLLPNGVDYVKDETEEEQEEEEVTIQQPPLLIATVVAPAAGDLGEARRAAARLEKTGRGFQREWAREQEELKRESAAADEEDG